MTPVPTGMVALDEALARLSDLDGHPVPEQYARLSRAHDQLQAALHGVPDDGSTVAAVGPPEGRSPAASV